MQIKFLRSNSLGLSGTITNAECHAKNLTPLVLALATKVSKWSFETWYQAHNVHVFRTKDQRNVILRPFGNGDYQGIKAEVSNSTRCANGQGILLAVLYADFRNGVTIDDFSQILKVFSSCSIEEIKGTKIKGEEEEENENVEGT